LKIKKIIAFRIFRKSVCSFSSLARFFFQQKWQIKADHGPSEIDCLRAGNNKLAQKNRNSFLLFKATQP